MSVEYNFSIIEKSSKIKETEDKRSKDRKTNILVLIRQFLVTEGYIETVNALDGETRLSNQYSVCDNIDIVSILKDYESYHYLRFQKYPKVAKKVETILRLVKKKEIKKKEKIPKEEIGSGDASSGVIITGIGPEQSCEKLLRGMGSYEGYSSEWRAYADVIMKDVIDKNLNTKWDDVIGLDSAKSLLKEAIVYPMKYPDLFKGILSPWKGLLLYGPPGTGKTLLAKAVATECNTTFFNISASSIVSKWRGDSEKLVRVMFEIARLQSPSTIFIDELDSLASKRDCPAEHEASRRLKSEFLVQLDGLLPSDQKIFLLTTSNMPWDLDTAILRRLEKHVFIDLPDFKSRAKLIELYLPSSINVKFKIKVDVDYDILSEACSGYSAADIRLLCKETVMESVRKLFPFLTNGAEMSKMLKEMKPIKNEDFIKAIQKTIPTVTNTEKFKAWHKCKI